MSAVSISVTPASRAAWTTAIEGARSMRQPTWLVPSPTTGTSSEPIRRVRTAAAYVLGAGHRPAVRERRIGRQAGKRVVVTRGVQGHRDDPEGLALGRHQVRGTRLLPE